MTDVTPPPELVKQWMGEFTDPEHAHWEEYEVGIATRAAQWGADQELEACLRLVEIDAGEDAYDFARYIRAARRPKPPSLKQQAVDALHGIIDDPNTFSRHIETIRRALEQLND